MTKILIVDNDKSIRRLCYEELTDLGYEVILSSDYSMVLACVDGFPLTPTPSPTGREEPPVSKATIW